MRGARLSLIGDDDGGCGGVGVWKFGDGGMDCYNYLGGDIFSIIIVSILASELLGSFSL